MVKKYSEKTPEQRAKIQESNRKWVEANRDHVRQKQKEYREKNKDKIKAYREENKEAIKESSRKHYKTAETIPHRFVNYLFSSCKRGAKDRNIPFKLTKEDIENLCINSNGKCALSGLPLTSERNNPMKASVDRIDSNKGYTKNNVQLVGAMVNTAKNDLTTDMFVLMCRNVAENFRSPRGEDKQTSSGVRT